MSVNLLPWRERKRHRQKLYMLVLLIISILLICVAFVGANRWLVYQINYDNQQNALLTREQSALAAKQNLAKKLKIDLRRVRQTDVVWRNQQAKKADFLQLLYAVSRQKLQAIYFTAMAMTDKKIIIAGRAVTQAALHKWLESTRYSTNLAKPKVEKIQQLKGALYPLQFVVELTWQTTIKN